MRAFSAGAVLFLSCWQMASAAGPDRLLAFERDESIWVARLDGSNPRKIVRGVGPHWSPDGTRLAFHTDASGGNDLVRRIAVVDVASKRPTIFKNEIPSNNCQRAVWSPDGARILFNIWTNNDWHLATVKPDGSGFAYLKKSEPKGDSWWSACWAPDGRSIYAQDLNRLSQFSLTGKELRSWELRKLFPEGSLNSGSSMAVSPDGRMLLMQVDLDNEEANMPDWDGPPPSIWMLNLESQKTTRLTPKGVLAWAGCWLDQDSILFSSQTAREKNPTISRMTVASGERKAILKNGDNADVASGAGPVKAEEDSPQAAAALLFGKKIEPTPSATPTSKRPLPR